MYELRKNEGLRSQTELEILLSW